METALYLIPCTLGETPVEQVLPAYNKEVILQIKHFIVEEVRTARRFLKTVDRNIDIDSLTFYPMGKHSDAASFGDYLKVLRRGDSMGVISEAGCPAVADPGAEIVRIAQREGLKVVPLVGPSSIILAIMASGFSGQSFAFHGYLPVQMGDREKMLKRLENRSRAEHQTQLFIETPYRNMKMMGELLRVLHPATRLCVASGLTCENEYVRTKTVAEWKKTEMPDLSKIPSIFLIYSD